MSERNELHENAAKASNTLKMILQKTRECEIIWDWGTGGKSVATYKGVTFLLNCDEDDPYLAIFTTEINLTRESVVSEKDRIKIGREAVMMLCEAISEQSAKLRKKSSSVMFDEINDLLEAG